LKFTIVDEKSLQQRPKTTPGLDVTRQAATTRPTTAYSSRTVASRASASSARTGLSKSVKVQDDDLDESAESVSLSLLSLTSDLNQPSDIIRKEYGKFEYFSYFERYLNQRAPVKTRFVSK
jgi:hypothetical protein